MARHVFKLPDVGEGIAEAELVAWHVSVGDVVAEDQPLADVMTDKATVELSAPVAGTVLELHGTPGGMVAIGAPLVVFETGAAPAAPPSPPRPQEAKAAAPPPRPAADPGPQPVPAPAAPPRAQPPALRPLASPAVRRRAEELGVRLVQVPGSGPEGRITHQDLDAFLQSGAPAPGPVHGRPREGVEQVQVIGLRRRIAARMAEAKRRIPHFSYVEEVDMTALEELRGHLNTRHGASRPRLSVLPFLVQALVKALPEWPQINATFDDEAGVVSRHAAVHAGIATQTPGGLMVPVLRHAEALDLWQMAAEIARLAEAARAAKATREELTGSTVTITSLGALGGVATTPVINHPEVAIIGPNRIVERPVVLGGQVVVRRMMNLSSSFDHRVVDGADAAAFIQRVKALLEHPATLFLD